MLSGLRLRLDIAYFSATLSVMEDKNPFTVPPFDGKNNRPMERFFWWSWHPLYPYWSKSCWGGVTERQARKALDDPLAGGMDVYHNKLIRENEDGSLTEVLDRPCQRLAAWRRIKKQGRKPFPLPQSK
jgi:hypothetical protein